MFTHTLRQGPPDAGSIHYPSFLVTKLLFCSGHCPQKQDKIHSHPCSFGMGLLSKLWPVVEKCCVAFSWGGQSSCLPSFAAAWNSDEKAGAAAAILGYEVISQWKTQARK